VNSGILVYLGIKLLLVRKKIMIRSQTKNHNVPADRVMGTTEYYFTTFKPELKPNACNTVNNEATTSTTMMILKNGCGTPSV